jgi:hypothetical protein
VLITLSLPTIRSWISIRMFVPMVAAAAAAILSAANVANYPDLPYFDMLPVSNATKTSLYSVMVRPPCLRQGSAYSEQPSLLLTSIGRAGRLPQTRTYGLVGHLSPVHSSNALIYHAVLATEWPISWQLTH